MKKRTAPIAAFLGLSLTLITNAASLPHEPLSGGESVKLFLKLEGAPQQIESVKGKVYSFDTTEGAEAPIVLMKNGMMTATLSLPFNGEDPINVQAAALITFKNGYVCKYSADQDVFLSRGVTPILRGVCS